MKNVVFMTAISLFMFTLLSTEMDKAKADTSGSFLLEEGVPPVGANDPTCQPDEAHPFPVVLVPGTFESMAQNWADLAPLLKEKGYCVYSLNYGYTTAGYGTGPIEDSAMELKTFIENVLQHTGSEKVSIVGHSQGGMMPRYYLKFLGGAEKVDDLIGLAPSNHGTEGLGGLEDATDTSADLISDCTACRQQLIGSEFLEKLNEGDETPGKVSYTNVATEIDEVIVPYTSSFLKESKEVSNITLQDYYPLDLVEHSAISYDLNAFNFVFDALAHEGPSNPDRAVDLLK
ncbi:triacylglycerol lipase [Pontibacillus sp. HMF3514]|uniref:esterase/lipase family protein n=1 Tax=Pontibacillus sp. HMF3514 TaxID=2692425 RepID=UPI00131FC654|nr:alpha/beta fold hydrolase [Pontibacillus sp. HMF3514]QHE50832.1 alpha/beta fold hydrolase [Pontibacillus sp. HMF3514]